MVEFKNISKSYDTTKALNNISFNVLEGEIFGLIGPDGAGKSTLMRILTTVLLPDSGNAVFDGHDVVKDYKQVRTNVGYMPGKFSLYQDLSVQENLQFFATIFNTTVEKNYHLIKDIYQQLEPFGDRKAGDLSGGMKQKLALSCALIHKPKLLVLDEPTFGVDAVSRKEFWEMLKTLKSKGVTIFVSTPYMDEASLCDRVALIQKGNILKINTPTNIEEEFDKNLYHIKTPSIYEVLHFLSSNYPQAQAFSFGQKIHVYAQQKIDLIQLQKEIESNGLAVSAIAEEKATIEDCFMDLMLQENLTENVAG